MSLRVSLRSMIALACLSGGSIFAAAPPEPIRYTLRFPAPESHYVEVEAVIPTEGQSEIELYMAVWTPGSYLVREYARNVEAVSAKAPDGKPLTSEKVRKNRWSSPPEALRA